jgi:hypothetical protein
MSFCLSPAPVLAGLVIVTLVCTGCTTVTLGDAGYSNGTITLLVTNEGELSEGHIQVTVYEITGSGQTESDVFFAPTSIQPGPRTLTIPGTLKPGRYKLYFYLFQNGERKAAAIRDLVVN